MTVFGLTPTRFLTLTAHFVITVAIFWAREDNVRAALPLKYTPEQYDKIDTRFTVALILTMVCFALEYFGFFTGLSMFVPSVGLLSACSHTLGCFLLAFFIWDVWDCELYWWIFAVCTLIPALVESFVLLGVFVLRKPF